MDKSINNIEGREHWEIANKALADEGFTLGSKISYTARHSLHGLLFILARYKFVMKMMSNRKNLTLVDLGCNDGFGDLMLLQNLDVKSFYGVDFDEEAIKWANNNIMRENVQFINSDFLGMDICPGGADCIYSLDVIEHIPYEHESLYLDTICKNLKDDGVVIIGTPNIKMYQYTNDVNKKVHINNYSQERLYDSLSERFNNVFIFGMNDEVLHTGFYPMSCYVMALCCGKRK